MLALFVDEFLETLFGDAFAIVFVGADDISLDDSMVLEAGTSSFWCWGWYSLRWCRWRCGFFVVALVTDSIEVYGIIIACTFLMDKGCCFNVGWIGRVAGGCRFFSHPRKFVPNHPWN